MLVVSRNRMKEQHDKHHREEEFGVGDWVYLKLRPYRRNLVSQQALYKLGSRFYGPFQIERRIGAVAYRLKLPEDSQVHPVFHVSQLKRRLGKEDTVTEMQPAVNKEAQMVFRPVKAVEYRYIKKGGRFRWEVLIEWESLPESEATWENVEMMKTKFPSFVLEDKEDLQGNEIDTRESRELKNAYNRARRLKIKEMGRASAQASTRQK